MLVLHFEILLALFSLIEILTLRKVAALGAHGLIGQSVVEQLVSPRFDLSIVSRDASKFKYIFPNIKGPD